MPVDIEAGFAAHIERRHGQRRKVLRAGAIGVKVKDGNHSRGGGLLLKPVCKMVNKIWSVHEMSNAYGVSQAPGIHKNFPTILRERGIMAKRLFGREVQSRDQ